MLTPDFSDRTYTAEVMRTKVSGADALKAILRLTREHEIDNQVDESSGLTVNIYHRFVESDHRYHRSPDRVVWRGDREISLPRTRETKERGKTLFLYDVFIAQCQNHVVVAVPFHDLAEHFFMRVDKALAGTRTVYEKLDITNMVINLGSTGTTTVRRSSTTDSISLSVTRCHLVYKDKDNRNTNLQQIRMTGANLGASEQYQLLVAPVIAPAKSTSLVTPVVLGFALSANEVKKSSATTDRHGNFKLWMAAGTRRLVRLFGLLDAIVTMDNVASTTSNVPILQSKSIRDAEE